MEQESNLGGCVPPAFLVPGDLHNPPMGRPLPKRNMGPGSQSGSNIIPGTPLDRTHVKTLPCPKLRLWAVKLNKAGFFGRIGMGVIV